MKRLFFVFGSALFAVMLVPHARAQGWQTLSVNTDASFRSLSVLGSRIWASGTGGTFIKTSDGGKHWSVGHVSGAEKLDFRDVEAFSAQVAYLLSIGPGENSRIYKTTDGGDSWKLQFQNTEKEGFFDALAFWDERHGLAMSDPVRGRFYVIKTDDGGAHWTPIAPEGMPAAIAGEGGFAASGTCLITRGMNEAFIVSGGTAARVFHSRNRGQTWQVIDTPMLKGSGGAGIFSIAFAGKGRGLIGVLVGGDYQKADGAEKNAAVTNDGGSSWRLLTTKGTSGFRSAVAFASGIRWRTVLAVGSSGSDISHDGGLTWTNLDQENLNAVAFEPRGGIAWAVGPKGRVAKMTFPASR